MAKKKVEMKGPDKAARSGRVAAQVVPTQRRPEGAERYTTASCPWCRVQTIMAGTGKVEQACVHYEPKASTEEAFVYRKDK